jgi:hypothetical protein
MKKAKLREKLKRIRTKEATYTEVEAPKKTKKEKKAK